MTAAAGPGRLEEGGTVAGTAAGGTEDGREEEEDGRSIHQAGFSRSTDTVQGTPALDRTKVFGVLDKTRNGPV